MLSRRDEFAGIAMHAMTTRRRVEAGEVADGAYAIADAMEARAKMDEGQDDAPQRCIETMVDQHAEIARLRAELDKRGDAPSLKAVSIGDRLFTVSVGVADELNRLRAELARYKEPLTESQACAASAVWYMRLEYIHGIDAALRRVRGGK